MLDALSVGNLVLVAGHAIASWRWTGRSRRLRYAFTAAVLIALTVVIGSHTGAPAPLIAAVLVVSFVANATLLVGAGVIDLRERKLDLRRRATRPGPR